MTATRRTAAVVVLGDLGRSPRMRYHAASLARTGFDVHLIGYGGTELPASVTANASIRLHVLDSPEPRGDRRPSVLKQAALPALRLLGVLATLAPRPDVILVQNPPAIPTLPAAWLAARARRGRLVVDWHNLGADVLATRLGARHPLVGLTRRHERWMLGAAHAHLSVSNAMAAALGAAAPRAVVRALHDRPADDFQPLRADERERALGALARQLELPAGRPAVVSSPTSFTPDEDFDVLLEAASRWVALADGAALPELCVVLSGKGERRSRTLDLLARRSWKRVSFRAPWLAWPDYVRLVGAADCGLSVHRSVSGLDLPMKIVDFFGAGVPVCALDYGPCLAEQIRHGENGFLFRSGAELAERLRDLFDGFPRPNALRERLRAGAAASAAPRWDDAWREIALPLFT